MRETALLILEDGTQWRGIALGARGERTGEVVFNTSMTGYQEVLTDPSYYGQIVVMTVSHVGNTGVNAQDDESSRMVARVRGSGRRVSSWRANQSLDEYSQSAAWLEFRASTRARLCDTSDLGAQCAALS
jgi:carbamoyl-phosphate synthase small subunit